MENNSELENIKKAILSEDLEYAVQQLSCLSGALNSEPVSRLITTALLQLYQQAKDAFDARQWERCRKALMVLSSVPSGLPVMDEYRGRALTFLELLPTFSAYPAQRPSLSDRIVSQPAGSIPQQISPVNQIDNLEDSPPGVPKLGPEIPENF